MSIDRRTDGDLPWLATEFVGWSIVGMNHYSVRGTRFLFVAMVKGGRCIQIEGNDDVNLWVVLADKAREADR